MKKTQAERSNSIVTNSPANFGRIAVTHVQGSPKGGGAWNEFDSSYYYPALLENMMRLQLVGNYTIEEFEEAVSTIVDSLKSNQIDSRKSYIV